MHLFSCILIAFFTMLQRAMFCANAIMNFIVFLTFQQVSGNENEIAKFFFSDREPKIYVTGLAAKVLKINFISQLFIAS